MFYTPKNLTIFAAVVALIATGTITTPSAEEALRLIGVLGRVADDINRTFPSRNNQRLKSSTTYKPLQSHPR